MVCLLWRALNGVPSLLGLRGEACILLRLLRPILRIVLLLLLLLLLLLFLSLNRGCEAIWFRGRRRRLIVLLRSIRLLLSPRQGAICAWIISSCCLRLRLIPWVRRVGWSGRGPLTLCLSSGLVSLGTYSSIYQHSIALDISFAYE